MERSLNTSSVYADSSCASRASTRARAVIPISVNIPADDNQDLFVRALKITVLSVPRRGDQLMLHVSSDEHLDGAWEVLLVRHNYGRRMDGRWVHEAPPVDVFVRRYTFTASPEFA